MRGNLETIVGAMFAGKTSELLKRILWAKHQNKNIIVIKPSIDNRYSNDKIITHNDLSHECFAMSHWDAALNKFSFEKNIVDMAIDRGKYICQSQSMNLFLENPTISKLTSMHFYSWDKGLKTGIYYLRSRPSSKAIQFTISPDCENCSA